ncbi:MAG TPA: pyridoxal phosphate-dependent aminotransferase [Acidimicrobiales bacterium]|nr:pyridoxal phosphate-dependent aminotransferase [Acidimicrobiales bacterium]
MDDLPTGTPPARRMPYLAARLQGLGTTIFAEMSALAAATGSINLGQGFPDTDGPAEVAEAAIRAIRDGANQYPPGPGTAELRQAISEHQKRFYGIEVDPDTAVLVTAGATEAVTAAVLALCETGDEVLTFEPFYDSYTAAIALAGAQRRAVPLQPPDWSFDPAQLAAAVTPRTRLLLLNTPHNPTGKVFSVEELDAIARICVDNDLIVVTDEVYEHLVFDGQHVPLATRPGMAERTLTVSSAGKTFSFTGWKVGWVTGPPALVAAVRTVKQFLTYVNGAPFQPAVALGLRLPDAFFASAAWSLREKRDRLCAGLFAAGFAVHVPAATYFVVVDTGPLGYLDGAGLCRDLPARCGVVAVPAAAFYSDPRAPTPLVRFAFCKKPDILDEAVRRLAGLRP